LDPPLANSYANRGTPYRYLGKSRLAVNDFDSALLINPNMTLAYHNRGIAYFIMDLYLMAIDDFNVAMDMSPLVAEPY